MPQEWSLLTVLAVEGGKGNSVLYLAAEEPQLRVWAVASEMPRLGAQSHDFFGCVTLDKCLNSFKPHLEVGEKGNNSYLPRVTVLNESTHVDLSAQCLACTNAP